MKRLIQIMLVGFSLIMVGCSLTLAPNVMVKPVSQYKFYQEQEGLKIAVDPFLEKNRLKDSFDGDLLSHGILPVFVVVENHHSKSGFLLDKRNFSIAVRVEQKPEAKQVIDPSVSEPKALQVLKDPGLIIFGAVGIVAPGVALIGLPILAIGAKKEMDIKEMNENMIRKAFIDRTVYPKETHSGFVYFNVKDREASQNIAAILVKAKSIPSDKELTFVFQIKN